MAVISGTRIAVSEQEARAEPELILVQYSTLQEGTLCTLRLDKVVALVEELVQLVP